MGSHRKWWGVMWFRLHSGHSGFVAGCSPGVLTEHAISSPAAWRYLFGFPRILKLQCVFCWIFGMRWIITIFRILMIQQQLHWGWHWKQIQCISFFSRLDQHQTAKIIWRFWGVFHHMRSWRPYSTDRDTWLWICVLICLTFLHKFWSWRMAQLFQPLLQQYRSFWWTWFGTFQSSCFPSHKVSLLPVN